MKTKEDAAREFAAISARLNRNLFESGRVHLSKPGRFKDLLGSRRVRNLSRAAEAAWDRLAAIVGAEKRSAV